MRPYLITWLEQFMPSHVAAAIAPSWFTCVGLAGLVGLLVMLVIAKRHGARADAGGIDRGMVASAVLWGYLAAVAAGILVPMAIELVSHLVATGQVRVRWAGMTSFWGYLAGLVAIAVVCRRHAVPLARFGDLAAVPIGVALVCARLGCFLAGCDYGKVTAGPWAMRFPSGSPAWRDHVRQGLVPAGRGESLPVHPTQLYEALLGLVIIGVAVWVARSSWARARHGRVFLAAAATYAVGRIGIECLRGDVGRGIYAGLSSGQIFSLFLLVAIAGCAILLRRRGAIAITSVLVLVGAFSWVRPAAAQPAPQPPPVYGPAPPPPAQPQPQPGQPQPQPGQQPQQPYQPYQPYPSPAPYPAPGQPYPGTGQPVPPPPPPPQQPSRDLPDIRIGVLFGAGIPLNRRPEQVRTLSGPSVSIGYSHTNFAVWLDFDSFGNTDASHGTLLFSAGNMFRLSPTFSLGGRLGIGPTLVNFDESAFQDIVGTSLRIEPIAEFSISRSWVLWARPFSFDTLIADDLGGPITTWQVRAGIAYAIGGSRPAAPAPAATRTASKR